VNATYRMSQEDRSIFWEVTVIDHSKQRSVHVHVFYSERFPRYSCFIVRPNVVQWRILKGFYFITWYRWTMDGKQILKVNSNTNCNRILRYNIRKVYFTWHVYLPHTQGAVCRWVLRWILYPSSAKYNSYNDQPPMQFVRVLSWGKKNIRDVPG
jgi:hypothetical protein